MRYVLIAVVLASMVGCTLRTIYVPTGEPVRIRRTIDDAPVWVRDKDGTVQAGQIDIPEGWYALPDPNR
jgi:hypothetical protein